jgi:hypothetical protein
LDLRDRARANGVVVWQTDAQRLADLRARYGELIVILRINVL